MPEPWKTRGRRRSVWVSLAALSAMFGVCESEALADTKQECVNAYDKVQDLRDESKLEEAIVQAQICARDVCSKAERDDCSKWKLELEARESSIVVDVVDASGAALTSGTVSLDGARWLDHLDASAHVVSQGAHTLEVTVAGGSPRKQSIVIQEGEKNRKIVISIIATPEPPPPPAPPLIHRVGPWIVGGVGVAALIGGAVTGGIVVHAHQVMKDECNDSAKPMSVGVRMLPANTCTQRGFDAEQRGHTLGPATTVLLAAGGALVAAGVIWLVVRPHAQQQTSASWVVAPSISGDQKGMAFEGRW